VHGTCCEPNTIDPAAVSAAATDGLIVNAAYEALTRYTIDGKIEPSLATSWKTSDDGLTFVFKLRESVKFHDGTDFSADAVKTSFDRMKAMKMGTSFLLDPVAEIKVVDATTVQITLSNSDAAFWFGLPNIKIISPRALAANRKSGDWAQDFYRENAVGTGPYRVERWDRGNQLQMVAFEGYWRGWEGKHIQRYILRFGMDMASRLLLLEKGDIHIIDWAGLSDVRRMKSNPKVTILSGASNSSSFYHWINTQNGPLKDVRVRKAMMLAFPYKELLDVMGEMASPMSSSVPENMAGYCKAFEPKQDLQQARQLLADAGYSGGFRVRQGYRITNEPRRLAAELFQASLAKLNVQVVLEDLPWANFLQAQSKPETAFDFVSASPGSPVPYAGTMLYNLGSSKVQGTAGNYSYYANSKFDALIAEAQRLPPDSSRGSDLLCQAQKMLIDDAVFIPLMMQQYIELRRAELKSPRIDAYSYPYDIHIYDMSLDE
jgi:peptide/nickel transport system substrate-binding protein